MKARRISHHIILGFGLIFGVVSLQAQWVRTSGPVGARSIDMGLVVVGGDVVSELVIAGTANGVSLSDHNGTNWATAVGVANNEIISTGVAFFKAFAGRGSGGYFMSSNGGSLWASKQVDSVNSRIHVFSASSASLFVGTDRGVFRYANSTDTWIPLNTGITNVVVRALAASDSIIYAGTDNGIFRSSNHGESWSRADSGLTTKAVRALILSGTTVYAGTAGGGVFRSANKGDGWAAVNMGLTSLNVNAFAAHEENVFAGTDSGVHLSSGNGMVWVPVDVGLARTRVHALAERGFGSPNSLFAATDSGVWRRPVSEMVTSASEAQSAPRADVRIDVAGGVVLNLATSKRVSLTAYSVTGRKTIVLINSEFPAGRHTPHLDARDLAKGLYVFRLQAGEDIIFQKVVHER